MTELLLRRPVTRPRTLFAPSAPSVVSVIAPVEEPILYGHTEPRLFTPPLRELTPDTSYGFDVVDFARDVLLEPLDPWEEWLVIHAGELLPNGKPRFRNVLVLVARQNGKTHLLKVLTLYWLFIEQWPLVLGTSTNLDYAKEAWDKAVEMAEETPLLAAMIPRYGIRKANGSVTLKTIDGCRYKIAPSNRTGGRSLSIDRLVQDELREHHDWQAWDAATKAMNARPYGQNFSLSNMGDDQSVVLDSLRDSCITFIESGVGDSRFGLFEWSAPAGAGLMDEQAWAAANPNLGYRIDYDAIAGDARRAAEKGGEEETGFRTEILCQRVKALDAAIDPALWEKAYVPGDLSSLRGRVALALDISPDRLHATLAGAAAMPDGRVRVQIVAAWRGHDATQKLRDELPEWIRKVKPRSLGWMPNGPAAALAADLQDPKKGKPKFPPSVTLQEIRAEISAVCMGLAEQVQSGQVVHGDEPLLNAHVTGAAKLKSGETWRFSRKGEGHCDAAYAAASAIHLARTLPQSVGRQRLIVAST